MEKQGSKACTDQSYLDGKSLTVEVGVDQNRYQDCCSEHRKHVLKSKKQHPRYSQGPGIFDRCIFFVHDVPPQNIFCNSSEHMQQEKTDYANLFAIGCIFLLLWAERR